MLEWTRHGKGKQTCQPSLAQKYKSKPFPPNLCHRNIKKSILFQNSETLNLRKRWNDHYLLEIKVIEYLENPKDSPEKLQKQIKQLSKVAGTRKTYKN